ncbi:hypothetical protein AB0D83_28240 [Streptomyces decoyicus]|uniref:hypothetical protein n=1 Tax=Streptomyces decoyicus TaxID=249567 RepID=UPI0033C177BF
MGIAVGEPEVLYAGAVGGFLLCGGALLVAASGPGRLYLAEPPALLSLDVLAVAIPLFLLQAGLQRGI